MKLCLFYTILISLCCFFAQCIEPVTVPILNNPPTLVVEGRFTNNAAQPQEVLLGMTTDFGVTPRAVRNATVTVKSTAGDSFRMIERDSGRYVSTHIGAVGKSYFVQIKLESGQIYQSDPEILSEPIEPDSVMWARGQLAERSSIGIWTNKDIVDVFVATPLRIGNKHSYLRWELHNAFQFSNLTTCDGRTCYFNWRNTTYEVPIISSQSVGIERTNRLKIGHELYGAGHFFLETHYFSAYQYSITAQAYNYWQRYKAVISQSGSIFDKIPAKVIGNVYNVQTREAAIGYFEVAGLSIKRIFDTYGDFKRVFPFTLEKGQYCGDLPCCNCLAMKAPNVSLTKPVWWR
jgi:hypothetical protein